MIIDEAEKPSLITANAANLRTSEVVAASV